jgi:hypothetical protein
MGDRSIKPVYVTHYNMNPPHVEEKYLTKEYSVVNKSLIRHLPKEIAVHLEGFGNRINGEILQK